MLKTAMNAPSILYRMARNEDSTESSERRIIIAKGPFIILAYGYLSLPLEVRCAAWINCPDGDVMSGEIEAVMRQWHQHAQLTPDSR
ncbi:MAG: hypothetical protein ABI810_03655 [Sphingomonas bacterium]